MIIAMSRNEPSLHSRCPQCHTVFRVTATQLKARHGMVRCGRCQHAFRADQHVVRKQAAPADVRQTKEVVKAALAPARKRTAPRKTPVAEAAPFPAAENLRRPTPLLALPRLRTRNVYWAAGCTLLVLLFAGQGLIFYGHSAARQAPLLRPVVAALCDPLPCRKLPPIDMRRMDLVETRVAPHPRYDRALRVKATLVNRAESVQRYPMLEVSLVDSQGQLVARRVYPPQDYLNKPETIQQGLLPQVAVNVQLDITSPGVKASGYEVLLLPPPE